MKRLKFLAIVLLCSCWDGERNGRRYDLEETCLKSHTEMQFQYIHQNGQLRMHPYGVEICDSCRIDTIWEKSNYQRTGAK